ncbi:MAG: protocatechuate 3,4-dioxygenase [Kiloniellales bacterium]|nr:protocatechuate 3,4-dioxygenase [Kiloniellales bacterium]
MAAKERDTRRRVIVAGLGAATLALSPKAAWALVATPRQTTGPFYPDKIPLDHDNDLLTVAGRTEPAAGVPLQVFGRVLNEAGRPVSGARVEIWQCDAYGHYHHPRDRGGRADPNFQGYGRTTVDGEGGYRFRTIRPVSYPGRTPHIHFAVSGPGFKPLTTQMYVAGEPQNARDGLYNRIRDAAARASVTVALEPAPDLEPNGLAGRFDIILGRTLFDG